MVDSRVRGNMGTTGDRWLDEDIHVRFMTFKPLEIPITPLPSSLSFGAQPACEDSVRRGPGGCASWSSIDL